MKTGTRTPHPARYWEPTSDGRILCTLCPRYCRMQPGQAGFCFIRENVAGRLVSRGYGRPTGFAVDPVEKKPLNHFLPGSSVLSFGTSGCNLGCRFCQNWDISKARIDEIESLDVTPSEVVALALREGCPSIAYTYNDPVIFAEYVIDVARLARAAGLRNVLVTAGYVTPEARPELFEYIDAANVDLKGFREEFYSKITFSHLEPVLDTLRWIRRETNVWLEITTLLIPGLNDGDDEVRDEANWIRDKLGSDVPLHFTAFHPDFRMLDRPHTPLDTVLRACEIAREAGLRYVYAGNVRDCAHQTTRCHQCGRDLIQRDWHAVLDSALVDGRCAGCGTALPGVFSPDRAPASNARPRRVRP